MNYHAKVYYCKTLNMKKAIVYLAVALMYGIVAQAQTPPLVGEKSAQDFDFIGTAALLISLVALGIGITALVMLIKQVKSQKVEPTKDEEEKKLKSAFEKIINLNSKMSNLLKRIDTIEKEINTLRITARGSDEKQLSQNTTVASKISTKQFEKHIKYAESLDGTSIQPSDMTDENSEFAYLIVNIESPTTATFRVNDMQSAQSKLISGFKYNLADFVNRLSTTPAPKTIITKKPGCLQLQDGTWVLTQRADIVME